jgi:hypothetical protein
MLTDELVEYGLEAEKQQIAVDIRIGLGYTAAKLSNGSCGWHTRCMKNNMNPVA